MSPTERWASGAAYEPYVGRWSRLVASEFLSWLAPAGGLRWLDVGCGTGALTETILNEAAPATVLGIDPSTAHVDHASRHVLDPRVEFAAGDASSIAASDRTFDHVVSGLVLNFVADPASAMEEMRRVTRPGGSIAAYVWDYSEGMQMIRFFWDAARQLDREAETLDEGVRFDICRPDRLRVVWEDAGLSDVEVSTIGVPTVFRDFDDYWDPFLGGQGPAPTYAMSLEPEARDALRELLRSRLLADQAGAIRLAAGAWAVRGTRP